MSAQPVRFTFDIDMAHQNERNSVLSDNAIATLIAEARREGHAAGFAEGEASAVARAEQQLAAAATTLADRAVGLTGLIDDLHRDTIGDAVTLSLALARKLAGRLLAAEPTAEIEALVAECLSSLDGVKHLVIRCEPMLADRVRDIATARIAQSSFSGRLVVLGDPDIAIGDARLEWADGGVVRDIRQLSADIDARIAEYFAARGITRPEET
jgi:flagellar assembly protein FliH